MDWDTSDPRDLQRDVVHVWQIALTGPAVGLAALTATLSQAERARAERFYLPEVRARFVVGRGVLRSLLSGYLCVAPRDVAFVYGTTGKPALDPAVHPLDLRFNLSHSADLAVCALALGREVGVDVEAVRDVAEADRIAARHFPAADYASYRLLSKAEQQEGFFLRWTVNEAYLKARGQGLASPVPDGLFQTLSHAAGGAGVVPGHVSGGGEWSAVQLPPIPGFVGALVVEGPSFTLACHRWQRPRTA